MTDTPLIRAARDKPGVWIGEKWLGLLDIWSPTRPVLPDGCCIVGVYSDEQENRWMTQAEYDTMLSE